MPGVTWNEPVYGAATGGGLSTVFPRPSYQNPIRSTVGSRRGVPDISLSAAVNGGTWVYMSYPGADQWGVYGGTSEGSPTFSAMVALADQAAGHRLGNINPALYQLYTHGGYAPWTGLEDVTEGDNSIGDVTGYTAAPGYDLTTGLGTVNAAHLVTAITGH
jgi:subtilase family serine protease